MGFIGLLQVILIVGKVLGYIEGSWVNIFIPMYISFGLAVVRHIILPFITGFYITWKSEMARYKKSGRM